MYHKFIRKVFSYFLYKFWFLSTFYSFLHLFVQRRSSTALPIRRARFFLAMRTHILSDHNARPIHINILQTVQNVKRISTINNANVIQTLHLLCTVSQIKQLFAISNMTHAFNHQRVIIIFQVKPFTAVLLSAPPSFEPISALIIDDIHFSGASDVVVDNRQN